MSLNFADLSRPSRAGLLGSWVINEIITGLIIYRLDFSPYTSYKALVGVGGVVPPSLGVGTSRWRVSAND